MENETLNPIQKEILKAFEQMQGKAMFTETVVAKKIRENSGITGKNKAIIGMNDIEKVVNFIGANQDVHYSLHLNSVNDILIKKDSETLLLNPDARKRRQSSEKSMSILTSSDLTENIGKSEKNKKKLLKKRVERKGLNIYSNFEDFDE